MRSGALDQEPGRGSARLVPQPDGYAEYVEQAREQARPAGPGQHRSSSRRPSGQGPTRNIPTGSFRIKGVQPPPRRGQRSIRTTITYLLILPVLTMIGLYIYAAAGTIGPAVARQHTATVNADIGEPDTLLSEAVEQEDADSYIYVASHGRALPDSKLQADYAATDATLASFVSGAAKAKGAMSSAAENALPGLMDSVATRIQLRKGVQAGGASLLVVFGGYGEILKTFFAFSTTLANPDQSIQLYEETDGLLDAGQGTQAMVEVRVILGGVIASGGVMTPTEYQLFETLYNTQVTSFDLANQPSYWQISPDPYWTSLDGHQAALQSPEVLAAENLEGKVLAEGSNQHNARLPITEVELQDSIGAATAPGGPLITAEEESRIGITSDSNHQGDVIEERLAAVGGAGLLVVILSTFLLLRFSRRITHELTGLRNAARTLAGERLPSVVQRLRAGDDVDVAAEAPPLDLKTRTREVGETADAFSAVQHTAIEATVEQAQLRKGVSNVFRSLARRNQSLVQRQLRMLDEMERGTQDPDALGQLFRLDHLTTRMRRQAEGLIILSGAAPGRRWRQPVPVVEALRGAISEIEDYVRVDLLTESPDYLTGAAVADVTHLLAELIENAVVYSPPATRVQVRGGRVANGYVVEIDDRGLGIPPAARDKLNERLAQPVEFDLADSDQLGLFVVS
ncbi:MAG TPA: nitrate- and nitrite sensing domain-containing protein, partial [Trebonia sp.]